MNPISGNEPVIKALTAMIAGGNFPHAILFTGSGEADALALWLAAAAVCIAPEKKPCLTCTQCKKALGGNHPDIYTARGSGLARSFHIEDIRFIRTDAYIRPNEGMRKVYMLLGAQMMTREAQNALLKVLEEPPQNVLFLLTCDNADALLPTIRSRAQLFLLQDNAPADQNPCVASLAEQCTSAFAAGQEWDLLAHCAPLLKDKLLFIELLSFLSVLFCEAAVSRSSISRPLRNEAVLLGNTVSLPVLQALFALAQDTLRQTQQNANQALLVSFFCAKMFSFRFSSPSDFDTGVTAGID